MYFKIHCYNYCCCSFIYMYIICIIIVRTYMYVHLCTKVSKKRSKYFWNRSLVVLLYVCKNKRTTIYTRVTINIQHECYIPLHAVSCVGGKQFLKRKLCCQAPSVILLTKGAWRLQFCFVSFDYSFLSCVPPTHCMKQTATSAIV